MVGFLAKGLNGLHTKPAVFNRQELPRLYGLPDRGQRGDRSDLAVEEELTPE